MPFQVGFGLFSGTDFSDGTLYPSVNYECKHKAPVGMTVTP